MKSVIITGATGFLGSNLALKLASENVQVYAVIRNLNKAKIFDNVKNIKIVICDLSEICKLSNLINEKNIDAFYHFAWNGTYGNERENYELQLDNIKYTCEAVKASHKIGCKKFIFAGSIMEYESIKYVPLSGSEPDLNYIYRTAKLAAHYMSKALAVNLKIEFICVTISNVYGYGEMSPRFINSTLRKLLNGEKLSFTSAEQLYDFIYISDAVNAFIKIGIYGKPYSNYYIGNKKQKPLKSFIIEMRNCVDENIEIDFGAIKLNGISLDYTEFDTKSLYMEMDFKCEVPFESGIINTIKWINSFDGKVEV